MILGNAAAYERRAQIVAHNKANPRACDSCSATLAADNQVSVCRPCEARLRTGKATTRRATYVALPGLPSTLLRQGWSRREAAEAVGISKSTVKKWVSGENNCPPEIAIRLAALLRVEFEELAWVPLARILSSPSRKKPRHEPTRLWLPRLEETMRRVGVSQSTLACLVEISSSRLSNYRHMRCRCPLPLAEKMAENLGVDLAELAQKQASR